MISIPTPHLSHQEILAVLSESVKIYQLFLSIGSTILLFQATIIVLPLDYCINILTGFPVSTTLLPSLGSVPDRPRVPGLLG